MEFNLFTLSNGIRVIHQEMNGSDVSHCGIIVNAGSRDENEDEQGLAHFIEHSIFKGTNKRKAYHILSGLDAVGGELNAYTSKEETAIYASFQNQYLEKAIELITDITFNSAFETKEINKEKDVIIDEINSYLDSPGEQIYDDFEGQIFAGHSIGRNILGTIESVKSFKRKDILAFMKRNFTTDRMVFSVVGKISEKKLRRLLDKHLGQMEESSSVLNRKAFDQYKVTKVTSTDDNHQTHVMIGSAAYGSDDPKRRSLILLNNILGGPAMNSRLNLGIREKYGFAYNIESSYTPYSDTGIFAVYFGTDNKVSARTHQLVMNELKKFRDKKLGVRQLEQAKKQLIGQIALSQEHHVNSMLSLGKSVILYGAVDLLSETYHKINAVTAEEIFEVANEIFDESRLSSLTFPGR
jgi:predicted Zn-dependent peptidase